jgi:hypothetical protein
MTKGQEIAYKWNSTGAWERQAEAIDAAIAEAVSQRTVECAETCVNSCRSLYQGVSASEIFLSKAILALNTPAPTYPFEKPCKHWTLRDDGSWLHYLQREPLAYQHLDASFTHCPFCGAPRKGN